MRRDVPGGDILYMNGPKVLDFTMEEVPKAVGRLLESADLCLADIDLFLFHQASKVVLDRIQRKLGIDETRFFRNYHSIGNTVSSTIPIAMKQDFISDQKSNSFFNCSDADSKLMKTTFIATWLMGIDCVLYTSPSPRD